MTSDFSQLSIDQTENSVKVTSASGVLLAQYPVADQGTSKSNSSTSKAAPATQWRGDQLLAVTKDDRGRKTTRTYERSDDGQQLYVTTRIESPRFSQPVVFRFVYDPTNGDSSAY